MHAFLIVYSIGFGLNVKSGINIEEGLRSFLENDVEVEWKTEMNLNEKIKLDSLDSFKSEWATGFQMLNKYKLINDVVILFLCNKLCFVNL